MAKYVPDISTRRWVVIASSRGDRPHDAVADVPADEPTVQSGKPVFRKNHEYANSSPRPIVLSHQRDSHLDHHPARICPFCPGNESLTPPETYRIGEGLPNKPGWTVRVIPNKYPITDVHEVIIHGPGCHDDVERLSVAHVESLLRAYRNRFRSLMHLGHVMIFCNKGISAGASLNHAHSQLVVVPSQINLDALTREQVANVVEETDGFSVYCPDFSQWPFETWIAPKVANTTYADLRGEELLQLADVFSRTMKRLEKALESPEVPFKQTNQPFVYNYYLYHGQNWFLRITPRSIHRAGFELGTGLSVNVVDPSIAAGMLREIK